MMKILKKAFLKLKRNSILYHINNKSQVHNVDEKVKKGAYDFLLNVSPRPISSCVRESCVQSTNEYDLQVIVPVYNGEKYIRKCLNSLDLGIKTNYIVTVINDGSTDNTVSILNDFKSNVHYEIITQKNKGFSGARNAGLNILKGKFITFVDSDDFVCAATIKKMLEIAIKEDADIVQGSYQNVTDKKYKTKHISDIGNIPSTKLRGMPWGKIYKAELFEKVIFPENYWFEDTIFAQVIHPLSKKNIGIKDICYFYLSNPSGITSNATKFKKAIDTVYINLELYKDRKKLGMKKNIAYYESLLRQGFLNYQRTYKLGEDIAKAIFIVYASFVNENFSEFHTTNKRLRLLEEALKNYDYGHYLAVVKFK